MEIICKVDNSIHSSLEEMHEYLRRFKIARAKYYHEFYPKKDLLTGEPIVFKEYNQYFSQDFLTKTNLKKWIKQNPEEGKKWAIEWLRKRKDEKNLVYAPSQVELESLLCPTMIYYNTIGGYYNITKELGFKDRYEDISLKFTALPEDVEVICDTREQKLLKLPFKTIEQKLDWGDYALAGKNNKGIHIERKNLNDFIGTLSSKKVTRKDKKEDSSVQRFERELIRAQKDNGYVVMLVESSLSDALSFNYLPQTKFSQAQPSHIFKNLRDLLNKYPLTFQVVFTEGRIDAVKKLIRIFELGEDVKKIDLQYAIKVGNL